LKRFLVGKDPEIALATHAVLIKTGDPDEVSRFATFEEKNRRGDFMKFISIGAALNRVHSTQALPALSELADSPLIAIKQGALEAIRAIKSKKSIPTLIKHLDDSDSMSRYIADISLSEILNMNYPPYIGLFQKDEGKYISTWKTWWEQEGRTIYDVQAKNEGH
jgi:HEAT repeat protein